VELKSTAWQEKTQALLTEARHRTTATPPAHTPRPDEAHTQDPRAA
jgi:hypothetical protein